MKIFGKNLKKNEILERVGDISQIGGIKYYRFNDGTRKGVRAVDINNACGMEITVLVDRALDISRLSYKSIPISWMSATREASPVYYESRGDEIARTFFGGLITTCGLSYMGAPCNDEGEDLGLHGRISNLPAEDLCINSEWEDDNYIMRVSGKIRETKVFGPKLELERKIILLMDAPGIIIEDKVTNIGSKSSSLMMLYHINIGYPLLDKDSELIEGDSRVTPINEEAKNGLDRYNKFSSPIPDYRQQLFAHDIEEDKHGFVNAAFINPAFDGDRGIGLGLRFNKNSLPYLIQCKQMGGGEYFCGIEPANSLTRGRKTERESGTLRFIDPGDEVKFRIEFNVLESNREIEKFKGIYCN